MDKSAIRHYYEAYADMVYRLGFTYMKNKTDAEDVVQEVFLKLVRQTKNFSDDEHVKAWLIVTTMNHCKSQLSYWWNKRLNIDEEETFKEACCNIEFDNEILDAIMQLPDMVRISVYLYYYEGYTSMEIAAMLNKPAGTIRSYLHKGRLLLKEILQEGEVAL